MAETREERFKKAVDRYLGDHDFTTISQAFASGKHRELLMLPAVRAYLSRPASEVRFGPDYEPILGEMEKQLYAACREKKDWMIPYRATADRLTDSFFGIGICDKATAVLHGKLQHETETLPRGANVFFVANAYDIYQVGGLLRHLQGEKPMFDALQGVMLDGRGKQIHLPKKGFSYLVFSSGKDYHVFTVIAVVNNQTHKVVFTGLSNSSQNEEYFRYLESRFNSDTHHKPDPENPYAYPVLPPMPFVDCSHHLQLRGDDNNCGLYRNGFDDALIKVLGTNQALRRELSTYNAQTARPEDTSRLANDLQEATKAQLPQYYQPGAKGCTPRPSKEIWQYHRDLRWDIGSLYLQQMAQEARREKRGRAPAAG